MGEQPSSWPDGNDIRQSNGCGDIRSNWFSRYVRMRFLPEPWQ